MPSDTLVSNGIYLCTHEHDGVAIVRLLTADPVMARVEMIDPQESTYQLVTGAIFLVVIAKCTFERVQ